MKKIDSHQNIIKKLWYYINNKMGKKHMKNTNVDKLNTENCPIENENVS